MSGATTPRVDVAILGPTGMVGQQFVRLLANHPWFRVTALLGSERSAGRPYGEVVDWRVGGDVPEPAAAMAVGRAGESVGCPALFSALPADAAGRLEPMYRDRGHVVFTNASPHRFGDGRVPVIPEVNGERLEAMLRGQACSSRDAPGDVPRAAAGTRRTAGAIVPNPNCVVAGLAPVLAAIDRAAGLSEVVVTTMQALSGAGLHGVAALAGLGNVIPDIPGEAGKIVAETHAIVGRAFPMSVAVHRVPVRDGHLASVRLRTRDRPGIRAIRNALTEFAGSTVVRSLPSAPLPTFHLLDGADRPQPLLDVARGSGMQITLGGLGADDLYDVRLTMLVHNTIRGAAGGSILNAELGVAMSLV